MVLAMVVSRSCDLATRQRPRHFDLIRSAYSPFTPSIHIAHAPVLFLKNYTICLKALS